MMRGVNAAIVGLLGAALYNPVWTSSVNNPRFGVRSSASCCLWSGVRTVIGRHRKRLDGVASALLPREVT